MTGQKLLLILRAMITFLFLLKINTRLKILDNFIGPQYLQYEKTFEMVIESKVVTQLQYDSSIQYVRQHQMLCYGIMCLIKFGNELVKMRKCSTEIVMHCHYIVLHELVQSCTRKLKTFKCREYLTCFYMFTCLSFSMMHIRILCRINYTLAVMRNEIHLVKYG